MFVAADQPHDASATSSTWIGSSGSRFDSLTTCVTEPRQMLDNMSFWLALLIAAIFLACSVVLRGTTHGSWELKLTDAALALLPIFIWLVFSGQLKELKTGSEGFSAAFQDAASASIDQAVEKLPVEALVADEKTLLPDIPKFI